MKISIFQDFKNYIHLFINLMFYFKGKSSFKSTFYVLWAYGFNSLLVFLRFFRIFLHFSCFLELFRLVLLPFNAQRSLKPHVLLLKKNSLYSFLQANHLLQSWIFVKISCTSYEFHFYQLNIVLQCQRSWYIYIYIFIYLWYISFISYSHLYEQSAALH